MGALSVEDVLASVLAGLGFPALCLSFFDEQPIIIHIMERETRRMQTAENPYHFFVLTIKIPLELNSDF
jgi:hypothetical protein